MAIEVFARVEKKFMLTTAQYEKMLKLIEPYMNLDKFNVGGKFYKISNVYYDTPNNELIRRSLAKPVYKEKLRLRGYGVPNMDDKVFLEIKKKFKGVVYKRRTTLILKDAYRFVDEKITPPPAEFINQQVLEEQKYFLSVYDLIPAVYISYDRLAFFGKEDPDFRITFDTNITTRREDVRLEKGSFGKKLLNPDQWLMEVKILNSVPLWFVDILNQVGAYSNTFSKYGTEYKQYCKEQLEKTDSYHFFVPSGNPDYDESEIQLAYAHS